MCAPTSVSRSSARCQPRCTRRCSMRRPSRGWRGARTPRASSHSSPPRRPPQCSPRLVWSRHMTPIYDEQRHPLSRRILHWVMALSILIMIGSGWRIYNASPIFGFTFPDWATLGGDVEASLARHGDPGVATAIAWHFAAMWTAGRRLSAVRAVGHRHPAISGATSCRSAHAPSCATWSRRCGSGWSIGWANTTPCRRSAYWGVLAAVAVMILSGIAIWKPVQTYPLELLFGGFQGARVGALPRDGRHRVLPGGACRAVPCWCRARCSPWWSVAPPSLRHAVTSEDAR